MVDEGGLPECLRPLRIAGKSLPVQDASSYDFSFLAYLQGKEVLYPHILYLLQERFQIIGMALFVEKDVFQKVAGTGVAYLIASYNTVLKPFDCGLFQGIVMVQSAPAPFYRY